jgi:hypothetical protein
MSFELPALPYEKTHSSRTSPQKLWNTITVSITTPTW